MKPRVERSPRQKLGSYGENLAKKFLAQKGFEIVASNWRTRWGEIDIVASRDDVLHFVEVKTRFGENHGAPHEAVNRFKCQQILGAAKLYLAEKQPTQSSFQIDVVGITLNKAEKSVKISYFENVVLDN